MIDKRHFIKNEFFVFLGLLIIIMLPLKAAARTMTCPPFYLRTDQGKIINPFTGQNADEPYSTRQTCGECHEYEKITKGYLPIFIPLLLSLLRKTNDMDVAIESRAFGAPVKRSYLEDVSLKGRDYVAMIVVFAFGAGLMWLSSYMGWGAGVTGWMTPADVP